MLNELTAERRGSAALSLHAAADLQEHLMSATNDLDRLQHLLSEACNVLVESFSGVSEQVRAMGLVAPAGTLPDALAQMQGRLAAALMALQFQDMSSQLIAHTHQRLRHCADRIADQTMGDDEDGPALLEDKPLRPNPVVQEDMSAGSIELF